MMIRSGLVALALAGLAALLGCEATVGGGQPSSRGTTPGAGASGSGGGAQTPNPPPDAYADVGWKPIHRLNNTEYNRTVADLLGTALTPADAFTIEEEAAGFNTVAEGLTMSPRQVADYFIAGVDLAADVFAKPDLSARIVTCQPAAAGDNSCAQQIVQSFGLRAFR